LPQDRWGPLHHLLADHQCTPRQAGRIAQEAHVQCLVLTHLQPEADVDWVLEEAGTGFSGRIVVGEDLMELATPPALCAGQPN